MLCSATLRALRGVIRRALCIAVFLTFLTLFFALRIIAPERAFLGQKQEAGLHSWTREKVAPKLKRSTRLFLRAFTHIRFDRRLIIPEAKPSSSLRCLRSTRPSLCREHLRSVNSSSNTPVMQKTRRVRKQRR